MFGWYFVFLDIFSPSWSQCGQGLKVRVCMHMKIGWMDIIVNIHIFEEDVLSF